MAKRILITGCGGQLGTELTRLFGDSAVPVDVDQLDITSLENVQSILSDVQPAIVINAAAYTAVDLAEDDRERCFAVNSDGVKNLAEVTRSIGAKLVQISTDYVFGDFPTERRPRRESDDPSPIGIYAQSKLSGEAAAATNPNSLVVRSCGLYGISGPTATGNFVTTMVRLGKERESVKVVDDQHCTPTSVVELARAIRFLAESKHCGVFHVTNEGETTWFEMAKRIFDFAGLQCNTVPITTAEYGAPAHRPPYSVLDCSKYRATKGPSMSEWPLALAGYLKRVL